MHGKKGKVSLEKRGSQRGPGSRLLEVYLSVASYWLDSAELYYKMIFVNWLHNFSIYGFKKVWVGIWWTDKKLLGMPTSQTRGFGLKFPQAIDAVVEFLPSVQETWVNSQCLMLMEPSPDYYRHLGNAPAGSAFWRSLSLSLCILNNINNINIWSIATVDNLCKVSQLACGRPYMLFTSWSS